MRGMRYCGACSSKNFSGIALRFGEAAPRTLAPATPGAIPLGKIISYAMPQPPGLTNVSLPGILLRV